MRKYWALLLIVLGVLACSEEDEGEDVIDSLQPKVISTQPNDGDKEVSLNTPIVITYNEAVQLGKSGSITVNNKTVESSVNGKQVFIDFALAEETDYIISISGLSVLDMAKNYADAFSFSFSTKVDKPSTISENLVVADPSQEAVNLYSFLKENYGQKIISATMANVNWNTNEAEWVKLHTGKYPAIATFDYIHLPFSPANWIDYSVMSVAEDWWNNNGIVSAGWHWIVPKYEGSTDYTYAPSETTFQSSNATIEGTWENNVVKADLEKIAAYLKLLQEKNIPVIWRPLHEAAGNKYEYNDGTAWFWWGAGGADKYKQLWIYMFNYFESQGLNNLIWVWTTQTKDDAFYPGDDYVDIIGRDIYNNSDASSIENEFTSIKETYPNKMVTLSECGNIATISSQWTAGTQWSYFMPWYDFERTNNLNEADFGGTDHQHANAAWWIDALNQNYVITRDQMPSLK